MASPSPAPTPAAAPASRPTSRPSPPTACTACRAIAALTAQNTRGVTAVHVPPVGVPARADRRLLRRLRDRRGQDRHAGQCAGHQCGCRRAGSLAAEVHRARSGDGRQLRRAPARAFARCAPCARGCFRWPRCSRRTSRRPSCCSAIRSPAMRTPKPRWSNCCALGAPAVLLKGGHLGGQGAGRPAGRRQAALTNSSIRA